MRNLIFVAFVALLTSCATTQGGEAGASGAASDHACGPDCSCGGHDAKAEAKAADHVCDGKCDCGGHGEKAAGYHAEGHPEVAHNPANVAEHVEALFTKLDTDADKALTKEEVGEHHLAQKFEMADADSDGKISHEEMIAFGKKMHAHMAEKKAEGEAAPEAEAAPETEAAAE